MKKKFKVLMSFFKALKKDEIEFTYTYYDGEVDWYTFYGRNPTPNNIRDIIFEFAIFLTKKYNINQLFSDTDTKSITLTIKPSENKIIYSVRCENFIYEDNTYSDDIRDEDVLEFLNEKGIKSVKGKFSGYGDSGEIHEDFEINGVTKILGWEGEYEKLINYLYDRLEAAFGGWEIDDGSRGDIEIAEHYGTTKMITIEQTWAAREWEDCQGPIEITENMLEE